MQNPLKVITTIIPLKGTCNKTPKQKTITQREMKKTGQNGDQIPYRQEGRNNSQKGGDLFKISEENHHKSTFTRDPDPDAKSMSLLYGRS